jgi:diguanylate cyclase (GGDEF)-like protein
MTGCVRETDIVGRLGGDEFTVILGELDEIGSVERVAHAILAKVAAPYRLGGDLAHTSASIGITLYPDDATDVATLLKYADQAMYAAKNEGRNRFHYYTPRRCRRLQTSA